MRELQDELMMVRLREAESLADLKEMKQKVMELETQTQIQAHQVRRLDDENENLKGKMEENRVREQGLKNLIKELERNIADLDGKVGRDTYWAHLTLQAERLSDVICQDLAYLQNT